MTRAARTNAQGLHLFEDTEVIATTVAVVKAGDGLSAAMHVEPTEHRIGDTVHVVIECTVKTITHEAQKDTGLLIRKHKLEAGTATMVPKELVHDMLEATRAAIEQRRIEDERARGVERIDFPGGDVDGADA
jgi:hypothetical protein